MACAYHGVDVRTERLTILVTREQKRELTVLAKRRRISVGELVRAAVAGATASAATLESHELKPTAAKLDALERAAAVATRSLERAALALDRAETELARTRAHFDAKPGEIRDAASAPRVLLKRAFAKVREGAS